MLFSKGRYGGKPISIEQVTNYPASDQITFKITVQEPLEMTLYLRIPGYPGDMAVKSDGKMEVDNGYYKITKTWNDGEEVNLDFNNELQAVPTRNKSVYFQRGPLVYAYSIPHSEEKTEKAYDVGGFSDYHAIPENDRYHNVKLKKTADDNFGFEYVASSSPASYPWYVEDHYLKGKVTDAGTNEEKAVVLIPMGGTVLRRVTFPVEGD